MGSTEEFVIPAQRGSSALNLLDSRLRGNDKPDLISVFLARPGGERVAKTIGARPMKSTKKIGHAVKEPEINVAVPPQDGDVLLPHERDQAPDPETGVGSEITGPREVIHQAARDIRRGLRNTDLHGIPSNVPGPGVAPEKTPGAEVPTKGPSGRAAHHKE